MKPAHYWITVVALTCSPAWADCDLSKYRAQEGLTAAKQGDALLVAWEGDKAGRLRMVLAVDSGVPTVRELAVQGKGAVWNVLGRNLIPDFAVVSGVRRRAHGLPEENRWDVFWDAPLSIPGAGENPNLPRKPEEIRRAKATYKANACEVQTDGARLEVSFPGLSMGIFEGRLQFTVYKGTNLVRLEAIAKTEEPSAAYIYRAGLKGFSVRDLERVIWRDAGGNRQKYEFGGTPNQDVVPLRAKNRLVLAEGKPGSIAAFPPPHQFFFAREIEVNNAWVWYRKDDGSSFSIGVRQNESQEGYNPVWIERVWALYNAPPGTWQHMPVYFYVSAEPADAARNAVLAFTHNDRYKPLPGYKTMATHFHTAFAKELADSGSLDTQAPWIPVMRAMGVEIAHIFDFHGEGHPRDPGPLRFKDLETYYEACRRHSDRDFLILPGEEANEYLGGHYNILFPKPVYWTHVRREGQTFLEQDAKYGAVYHTGSAAELYDMAKREGALIWQTHPRTKGSTFYPDRIREADYFRGDNWLGIGFKAMPVDLSQKRLCAVRCFGALDDISNWGRPKYMIGEVDTYKKFPEYSPYGDFNINYIKLDALPLSNDWSSITRALRAGQFFVSTGEVLIKEFSLDGQPASGTMSGLKGKRVNVAADLEWTFPLEFVEVVWGDGDATGRRLIPATDKPPFSSARFSLPLDLTGKKWVRMAAWDAAGDGAFTQPVHLQ